MNKKKLIFPVIVMLFLLSNWSCNSNGDSKPKTKPTPQKITIPDFNADSAFNFIAAQVSFGPRVPNTKAHKECGDYLENTLKRYTPHVVSQKAQVKAYDNSILNMRNIIASFKPETNNRIFLAAHWDSRPYADHDPDPKNHKKPIDGANDGASGVGVLLEIARNISKNQPLIGVDIILFDTEDYGEPQSLQLEKENTWCLGSQYWSNNPHTSGYYAKYGILLDMVGAKNATFPWEGVSYHYASDILKKVWQTADELGYSNYFIPQKAQPITDDHLYINTILKIPTIDIVHLDNEGKSGFYEHWHTVEDNLEKIDKNTLKAVGQTVITVVYREK